MTEPTVSLVRAVQYLRMSTEHQRYSLENQAAVIAAYALSRGYHLGITYLDAGKSGLTLSGRPGLQQLLSDALNPGRDFSAILVLDVSRWGRFQNPDEAAHYEFLCANAGVSVIYCAEPFENDLAMVSTIIKHLKRAMAGEYSRELSEKVLRAQLQQARLGFKQGGGRPYGVRRALYDHNGNFRSILEDGQRKAVHDDRVMFVRGPPDEIRTIRAVFRLFTKGNWSLAAIARHLNDGDVATPNGRPWHHSRVRQLLTNELSMGFYTFNRSTRRMKSPARPNAPGEWVRVKVMNPIISPIIFEAAAQRLIERPNRRFPDSMMIKALRQLLRERGRLCARLIDDCPYTPHSATYRERFGSLAHAYALIAHVPNHHWRGPHGKPATDKQVLALLRRAFARHGHLSERLINLDRALPSVSVIQRRFGNVTDAYRLAGLPHSLTELQRAGRDRGLAKGTVGRPRRKPRWPAIPSKFTDQDLLEGLQRLANENGFVTAELVNHDPLLPTPAVYAHRFGSLLAAYEKAGLPAGRKEIWVRAGLLRHARARSARPSPTAADAASRSGDSKADN